MRQPMLFFSLMVAGGLACSSGGGAPCANSGVPVEMHDGTGAKIGTRCVASSSCTTKCLSGTQVARPDPCVNEVCNGGQDSGSPFTRCVRGDATTVWCEGS